MSFEKLESKKLLASVGWDGVGQGDVELNYYLGDAPAQVGQSTFEAVIEDALEVWSDVADITFTETSTPQLPDSLDITFESLDGNGGVLAQAYFPDDVNRSTIAGDIQFDSAESWEVGNAQGSQAFDLLYVAVHEIGHALGLEHSDAPGSVLNDTLSPNQQFTGLTDADRDAALALYAPAVEPTVPVDPPETPTEPTEQPPIDPIDETPTTEQPPADPEPDDPIDSEPTDRWNTRWRRFLGLFGKRRFFSIDFSDNFDRFDTNNTPNISEVTTSQFRTSIPWSIGFRR